MAHIGIRSTYFGKAGQLFVMSEFLLRGWNVAIPEVDQGDDIFVVRHADGSFRRVQVKSANATGPAEKFTARFSVARSLIYSPAYEDTPIHIALLVRQGNRWSHLFLMNNVQLSDFLGLALDEAPASLTLTVSVQAHRITCRDKDFARFLDNFEDFPSATEHRP